MHIKYSVQSLHGFYTPICDMFIGPKFKWGPVVQDAICIEMGISNACIVISKTPSSKQMNSMWVIVVAEAHELFSFIRQIIFSNSIRSRTKCNIITFSGFEFNCCRSNHLFTFLSDLEIKISI